MMTEEHYAEWLQKLILLGIGLIIGASGDLIWLPYDSQARYILETLVEHAQSAAPAIILVLIACYVGLETLTEDVYVGNVVFNDHE